MLDFDSDTLLIGKLKTISTETEIKELLDAYDPDATPDRNVELLGKSATIKLPTLKAAAELLCSLHEDYPLPAKEISASKAKNKELIAADIVRFIRRCRESKCLKCSSDYIPFSSTNTGSAVTCHFCHNPSHLGCYSDSVLDLEAGVVYLCPCCLGSQIAPEHVAPPPVLIAATIAAEHAAESEHAHHQPVITEHPNTEAVRNPTVNGNDRTGKTDSKKKKPCYDRSKAVCPLLLEGNCSHGISGKNCSSYHPPWCSRFQYNGRGGERGCHKVDDKCRFFHPLLCQNAVSTGACLNKPCRKVHIRGTITTVKDLQKRAPRDRQPSAPSQLNTTKDLQKRAPRGRQPSAPSQLKLNRQPPNARNDERPRPQDKGIRGPRQGRTRTESSSSTPPISAGSNRTRAVSFNESRIPNSNADFLKHLSSMKADLSKEIAAIVHSSLQNLLTSSRLVPFQQVQQQPPPPMFYPSQLPQFQRVPQAQFQQAPQAHFLQHSPQ